MPKQTTRYPMTAASIAAITLFAAVTALAAEESPVIRLSQPVEQTADAESFGAPLDESVPQVSLQELVNAADEYVGQSVRVVTRVAEVCQKKGCFFLAQEGSSILRISFKDYGFFVPTDIGGKRVTLVGELVARDLSAEEAVHYTDDLGGAAQPLKAGKVYEIVATSVRVPRG